MLKKREECFAPVVLFAYKRRDKLEKCLQALEANYGVDRTVLYVFCDGPKKKDDELAVQEVREYMYTYKEKCKFRDVYIVESEKNKGLANSIIDGVTDVINKYGSVIVVEDDLITTSDFLHYMNGALTYYKEMKEYGSISAYTLPLRQLKGYSKDIYVTRKGECWGWGTWQDRWDKVDWSVEDFDEYFVDKKKRKLFNSIEYGLDRMLVMQMNGEIDSWAVRWCYHLFFHGLFTVYPKESKTFNIGFDGSGTHGESNSNFYGKRNKYTSTNYNFERLTVNYKLEKESSKYVKSISIKNMILSIYKKVFKL